MCRADLQHILQQKSVISPSINLYFLSSTSIRHAAPAAELAEAEERAMILETEQRLEKFRRCHQEKENQELELLRLRQTEAEQELEELKRKREERREAREGEERRRGAEEQQRQAKEEVKKHSLKTHTNIVWFHIIYNHKIYYLFV